MTIIVDELSPDVFDAVERIASRSEDSMDPADIRGEFTTLAPAYRNGTPDVAVAKAAVGELIPQLGATVNPIPAALEA